MESMKVKDLSFKSSKFKKNQSIAALLKVHVPSKAFLCFFEEHGRKKCKLTIQSLLFLKSQKFEIEVNNLEDRFLKQLQNIASKRK